MSNPEKILINAIIRDFHADHPDFEVDSFSEFAQDNFQNQAEKGIVKAILGPNNKPEYNGHPDKGTGTTSGKANFDQWYADDIPGLNKKIEYQLEFKHIGDDVYEFNKEREFFPIDNVEDPNSFVNLPQELFYFQEKDQHPQSEPRLTPIGEAVFAKTKQARNKNWESKFHFWDHYNKINHNFHFTLEIVTTFTYEGTETFTFEGDDDLWIFIDRKLVIDLGGLHQSQKEFLDLNLKSEENQKRNQAENKSTKLNLRLNEHLGIKQADQNLALELEVGKNYELRIFYAERHTPESNCVFTTSLRLQPQLPVTEQRVRIDATQPYAVEPTFATPAIPGQFRISLDKPAPAGGIIVKYELVNDSSLRTAREILDFTLDPAVHEVLIPEGQVSAFINVIPVQDSFREGREAVVAKLIEDSQGRYKLGDQVQDTVFIRDLWHSVERIVCVAPIRTIVRREEEIVIIRKVRKVEEVEEEAPACPINTFQVLPKRSIEPVLRSGTAYVHDSVDNQPSQLYSLDLSTGKATLIGAIATGVYDIAFVGSELYGLNRQEGSQTMQLLKIDLATGKATIIGDIGSEVVGLSYNRALKTLYGVEGHRLIAINTETGKVTHAVPVRHENYLSAEIAFDSVGKAYITLVTEQNKQLRKLLATINMETHHLNIIGDTGFPSLGSIEFYDNVLYGVTGKFEKFGRDPHQRDGQLIQIDTNTGIGTFLRNTDPEGRWGGISIYQS